MTAKAHHAYDPRDPEQLETVPETWKPTMNAVLLQVQVARELWPTQPVDWDAVTKAANYCDELVSAP